MIRRHARWWKSAVLCVVFAVLPAKGSLPDGCGELRPEGPKHGCPWAFVVQHTARAPLRHVKGSSMAEGGAMDQAEEETPQDGIDEVTVYFYTHTPVKSVRFSLPERQDCEMPVRPAEPDTQEEENDANGTPQDGGGDDDPVMQKDGDIETPNGGSDLGDYLAAPCDGYRFVLSASGSGCELRGGFRPERVHSDGAVDLVEASQIKTCETKNDVGEGADVRVQKGDVWEAVAKRATAWMELSTADSGAQHSIRGWQYFTIVVSNPTFTPVGEDVLLQKSNAFLLKLLDKDGEFIGGPTPKAGMVYLAAEIRQPWACKYSEYVATSSCTARCGGGVKYSIRHLLNPPPKDIDRDLVVNCNEPLFKTNPCNIQPCSIGCQLGDWIRWADGPCSADCGGGVEIQRRRVVKAPVGGGAQCVDWDDPARMRTRACNTQVCPTKIEDCVVAGKAPGLEGCAAGCSFKPDQQRCVPKGARCDMELAPRRDGSLAPRILGLPCTRYCGAGKRYFAPAVARKDFNHEVDSVCGAWQEEACNTQPCQDFEFFPAVDGDYPIKGEWFHLVLSFKNEVAANSLSIQIPSGYEVDHARVSGNVRQCRLMEHNLPRMQSCEIVTSKQKDAGKDRQDVHIKFANPLEPLNCAGGDCSYRKDRVDSLPASYQLSLWVKHPKDCPDGVTSNGLCTGPERAWVLLGWGREHAAPLWFSTAAGYELYDSLEAAKQYVADHVPDQQSHGAPAKANAEQALKTHVEVPGSGNSSKKQGRLNSRQEKNGTALGGEPAKNPATPHVAGDSKRKQSLVQRSREADAKDQHAVTTQHGWEHGEQSALNDQFVLPDLDQSTSAPRLGHAVVESSAIHTLGHASDLEEAMQTAEHAKTIGQNHAHHGADVNIQHRASRKRHADKVGHASVAMPALLMTAKSWGGEDEDGMLSGFGDSSQNPGPLLAKHVSKNTKQPQAMVVTHTFEKQGAVGKIARSARQADAAETLDPARVARQVESRDGVVTPRVQKQENAIGKRRSNKDGTLDAKNMDSAEAVDPRKAAQNVEPGDGLVQKERSGATYSNHAGQNRQAVNSILHGTVKASRSEALDQMKEASKPEPGDGVVRGKKTPEASVVKHADKKDDARRNVVRGIPEASKTEASDPVKEAQKVESRAKLLHSDDPNSAKYSRPHMSQHVVHGEEEKQAQSADKAKVALANSFASRIGVSSEKNAATTTNVLNVRGPQKDELHQSDGIDRQERIEKGDAKDARRGQGNTGKNWREQKHGATALDSQEAQVGLPAATLESDSEKLEKTAAEEADRNLAALSEQQNDQDERFGDQDAGNAGDDEVARDRLDSREEEKILEGLSDEAEKGSRGAIEDADDE